MPEVAESPEWVFRLATFSRHKTYRGSRRPFGFEIAGRMVMIGHTPANEEVFIVLADPDAIENPLPDRPAEVSNRSTCMRAKLSRAVFAMLAYMCKRVRYRSVMLADGEYPSLNSDIEFSATTNIL